MRLQRRFVSHEPDVAEGVGEAALTVNSPRNGVILDAIGGFHCSDCEGIANKDVGIIDEDFNSNGGATNDRRTRKSTVI